MQYYQCLDHEVKIGVYKPDGRDRFVYRLEMLMDNLRSCAQFIAQVKIPDSAQVFVRAGGLEANLVHVVQIYDIRQFVGTLNADLLGAALASNPYNIKFMPQTERLIKLSLELSCGASIKCIKPDIKMALISVEIDPANITLVPREMYIDILREMPECVLYIENPSDDMYLAAATADWKMLQYVTDKKKSDYDPVVAAHGLAIQFIDDPDHDTCMLAVTNNGLALKFVKPQWQTDDMCLTAVRQNGLALQSVAVQTAQICMEACRHTGSALRFVKNPEYSVQMAAIMQDGYALRYVKKPDYRMCELAVNKDPLALEFVTDAKINLLLAIPAVDRNGLALRYVIEKTANVCRIAVQRNKLAVRYIYE